MKKLSHIIVTLLYLMSTFLPVVEAGTFAGYESVTVPSTGVPAEGTIVDSVCPSGITSLTAVPSTDEVELSWVHSTSIDVSNQILKQKVGTGTFDAGISLGTSPSSSTISGLSPNTTYTFRIEVEDFSGNNCDIEAAEVTTTTLSLPGSGGSGGSGGGTTIFPGGGGGGSSGGSGDPTGGTPVECPQPITVFTALPSGTEVTLEWIRSTSTNIENQVLKVENSGEVTEEITLGHTADTVTIYSLDPAEVYTFTLQTIDSTGYTCDSSSTSIIAATDPVAPVDDTPDTPGDLCVPLGSEIICIGTPVDEVDPRPCPLPVTNLNAAVGDKTVSTTWTKSASADVGNQLLYIAKDGVYTSRAIPITTYPSNAFWHALNDCSVYDIRIKVVDSTGFSCPSSNAEVEAVMGGCISPGEPAPPLVCGDGIISIGLDEECDDGNTADGDGCSSTCQIESTFIELPRTPPPFCGDGLLQIFVGETCDDANVSDGDGCSSLCQLEEPELPKEGPGPYCGDGILQTEIGEECDDGNSDDTDACSNNCQFQGGSGEPGSVPGEAGESTPEEDICKLLFDLGLMKEWDMYCKDKDYGGGDGSGDSSGGSGGSSGGTGGYGSGSGSGSGSGGSASGTNSGSGNAGTGYGGFSGYGPGSRDRLPGYPQVGIPPGIEETDPPDYCTPLPPQGGTQTFIERTYTRTIPQPPKEVCMLVVPGFYFCVIYPQAPTTETVTEYEPGPIIPPIPLDPEVNYCSTVEYPQCGDGVRQTGNNEQCDDGNLVNGDGCDFQCQREYNPFCGDGVIQGFLGETCDDGNHDEDDGCNAACFVEECGDGIVQVSRGEECEDGNISNDDGCSSSCTLEQAVSPECGDGLLSFDLFEQCDDGNTESGDGCSDACQLELVPLTCGDGVVDPGETCDDGNRINGDGCHMWCGLEPVPVTCQDGNLDVGEQCDDGNNINEDGCNTSCRLEYCGDRVLQTTLGEACDDGNNVGGDGCNALCQVEPTTPPDCGDGNINAGEQCDDGNLLDGDGCSSVCTVERKICGDGSLQTVTGEQCDDGNTISGDGCSANCLVESPSPLCGDGFLQTDLGEECDDGNLIENDGCTSLCRIQDEICVSIRGFEFCIDDPDDPKNAPPEECLTTFFGTGICIEEGPLGEPDPIPDPEILRSGCPVDFDLTIPADSRDFDGDGLSDSIDPDDDNDGVLDIDDDLPYDSAYFEDFDRDCIPDPIDPDWDNDDILNEDDNCPRIFNTDQVDSDLNGTGDACDQDRVCIAVKKPPRGPFEGGTIPLRTPTAEEVQVREKILEQIFGLDVEQYDVDRDGLPDYWEEKYFGSITVTDGDLDSDSDGLTDRDEYNHYTDPRRQDTDNDGLTDFEEIRIYITNPKNFDTDGDSISDFLEVNVYKSNPLQVDSDNDGFWDGMEITSGTDPLNPADAPEDLDGDFIDDAWVRKYFPEDVGEDGLFRKDLGVTLGTRDSDDDGLSDMLEYWYGTNPTKKDTDGDGFTDGEEVVDLVTDPKNPNDPGKERYLKFTNWKNGDISAGKQILIRGLTHVPNLIVKVYAIDIIGTVYELGETESDDKGKFAFVSKELNDGEYILFAYAFDQDEKLVDESDPVRFVIDTLLDIDSPNLQRLSNSRVTKDDLLRDIEPVQVTDRRPSVSGTTVFGSFVTATFKSLIFSSALVADTPEADFNIKSPEPLEIGDHHVIMYAENKRYGIRSDLVVVPFVVEQTLLSILVETTGPWWVLLVIVGVIVAILYRRKKRKPKKLKEKGSWRKKLHIGEVASIEEPKVEKKEVTPHARVASTTEVESDTTINEKARPKLPESDEVSDEEDSYEISEDTQK